MPPHHEPTHNRHRDDAWAAFDEEWLFNEVAKRTNRRSLSLWAFVRIGIGKRLMTFGTERHWVRLVKMVDQCECR